MYDSNTTSRQINYPLVIFIVLQVIFVIIGIATIVSQLGQEDAINPDDTASLPHISITDFSKSITNIPEDRLDFIQSSLLNIASINQPSINMGDTKALVREGSVHEHNFAMQNVSYASAIIDIPELSQSYQLFLQYSNDKYNRYVAPDGTIIFLCLADPADIIYPDFNCTDTYSQNTRNSIIEQFLKYIEFDNFWAGTSQNLNEINIIPKDFSNINADEFISQAQEAVRSFGISPDLFSYRVTTAEEYNFIQSW